VKSTDIVASIILAAGEAQRFGSPKPLLDWHGEPFIHHIASTALASGLSPVIAVSGTYPTEVQNALKNLPVTVVHNSQWQDGQSTSVQAGLRALPSEAGAVIFLLADQPQVPARLLQALVEKYIETGAAIVAPWVGMQRGNPVLFDRVTFPDFMVLEGDIGGRALFARHKVIDLPWDDPGLLLDVDTSEDYQRLLDAYD
jgi:molybdenum cofactor cytidylyltransferase